MSTTTEMIIINTMVFSCNVPGIKFDKIMADIKGQLNSELIYEFIVSPKMPTKSLKDFCPGSLLLQG